jgi:hypothetical protein
MTVDANLNQITIPFDPQQATSSAESLREALHVGREIAVVGKELDVSTIDLDAASSLLLQVLLAAEGSEAPVLGDDDLLAARELVLGATESLESDGTVCILVSIFEQRVAKTKEYSLESRVRTLMMI